MCSFHPIVYIIREYIAPLFVSGNKPVCNPPELDLSSIKNQDTLAWIGILTRYAFDDENLIYFHEYVKNRYQFDRSAQGARNYIDENIVCSPSPTSLFYSILLTIPVIVIGFIGYVFIVGLKTMFKF